MMGSGLFMGKVSKDDKIKLLEAKVSLFSLFGSVNSIPALSSLARGASTH